MKWYGKTLDADIVFTCLGCAKKNEGSSAGRNQFFHNLVTMLESSDYHPRLLENGFYYVQINPADDEELVVLEKEDNEEKKEFDYLWQKNIVEVKQKYEEIARQLEEYIALTQYLSNEEHREQKEVERDTIEYLGIWRGQVVACFKTFNRFMEHLSGMTPKIGLSECKTTYAQMIEAVKVVTRISLRALVFYDMVFKMVPFEDAIARIKSAHGNLTEFAQILQRTLFTADPITVLGYLLSFLGPVGISIGIAAGVGLLFSGWGALIIAGGAIAGVLCGGLYHAHRKSELKKVERKISRELAKLEGFFQRWHDLDKNLKQDDLSTILNLLNESEKACDIVCKEMFPALTEPMMLVDDCYVCHEALVPHNQEITPMDLKIPLGYKAQKGDVIASLNCEKKHLVHAHCYLEMREKGHRLCGLCRKEFHDNKSIQIVYRNAGALTKVKKVKKGDTQQKEKLIPRIDRKASLKESHDSWETISLEEWRQ